MTALSAVPAIAMYNNQDEKVWEMKPGFYLLVEKGVIQTLVKFRQNSPNANESGGLLIGYFRGDHLHITMLTTPMPGDRCSRTRFERRDLGHIKTLETAYKNSGGSINLLGEWHTHPERHPTPSPIDKKGWVKLQNIRMDQRTVFIIVGTESIWVGDSTGKEYIAA